MSLPAGPAPADTPDQEHDIDAKRWQEAKALRAEHRGWVVVWLAAEAEFRAYRRLPGARRDTALRAATAADMTKQIVVAESSVRPARPGEHGVIRG